MDKIKSFFSNKWTVLVEGIVIALSATGLILAGKDIIDIQQIPAGALGVVTAVEALITIIQGLFKKSE